MSERMRAILPAWWVVISSLGCATPRAAVPYHVHVNEPRTGSGAPAVAAAAPSAGQVTNRMHPGDPIQSVFVAGFSDLAPASAFIAASFDSAAVRPVFLRSLARGDGARFADAARPLEPAYLVIYYNDERGRPVLLSLVRAHTDIPLAIGSCGYQLLLTLDATTAAADDIPIQPRDE